MDKVQGTIDVVLLIEAVAAVALFGKWACLNVYYRPLVSALHDILDYTRFQTACEIRERYLAADSGWRYSLDEFVFVLECFERQHAATVRERAECLCGSCQKEYALSFRIRRRDRRKKRRSGWLEAGELVPLRA